MPEDKPQSLQSQYACMQNTDYIREQLMHRRAVPQSSTMSPNNPEHDDAEGWCKMAMNYTKGKIAELIGDSD